MAEKKRFGSFTAAEIEEKKRKTHSDNTIAANNRSANCFRAYLREKGQDIEFEEYETARLAETLGFFYIEARTADGGYYKTSSLENIRHGLNRYLNSPPCNKNIDLIKGVEFSGTNQNYKAAISELKKSGKGDTDHYPEITDNDLKTLYSSVHLNPNTPAGLANKVQFDIRLYFMRRGSENMHTMTKSTFVVKTDDTGAKYVQKDIDELTKNHRATDKSKVTGAMPEMPGNTKCPVLSFETYLEKLHPECTSLWQRPKGTFLESDEVWYCNSPIGESTLAKFLSSLSKKCELSTVYTNHSLRATGATILSRNKYGAAQISAVSGHRSVSSLAVYQRVNTAEKLEMGKALGGALMPENQQLAIPGPSTKPQLQLPASRPSTSATTTTADDLLSLTDSQLTELLADMPPDPVAITPVGLPRLPLANIQQNLSSVSSLMGQSGNMPILIGCTIGSIQIINK